MLYRIILILILVILQSAAGLIPGNRDSGIGGLSVATFPAAALAQNSAPSAVLQISPREVNLGSVGPGQVAEGRFTLRSTGPSPVNWSTHGPDGWLIPGQQELMAVVESGGGQLQIRLRVLTSEEPKPRLYPVRIDLETGAQSMSCAKELQPGTHRETMRLVSPNGVRTVFFRFKLIRPESEPLLAVEPLRVDLGRVGVGQQVSKVIKVTNRGRNALRWFVDFSREGSPDAVTFKWAGTYPFSVRV